LLRAGLVDELVLYVAPLLMGNGARGLFELPAFATLSECITLRVEDLRAVGQDWRIIAAVAPRQVQ
jgi:diaminohydroxyphosphoribosylaminopyrimidine deaminase/5-amino-6-(5-phosphoribosylamino)uracil reductase